MAKLKKNSTNALRVRREYSDIPVELPADGVIEKNEYYVAISRNYKLARLAALAMFLLYVLFMLATKSEDLTVANLQYLMRDLNLSTEGGEAFSGVSYSAEPIQRFGFYRNELAYVTGRGVDLYAPTGSVGLSATLSYENPSIVVTDQYMMIYDLGGTSFSVYNSFSELSRGATDHTIIAGDMSKNGSFVLVTEGREYRAMVYLYNSDFELRSVYKRSSYVSDAAISSDGGRLAMTSFGADGGEFYTDVYIYEPGVDEPISVKRIAGEYPLSLEDMGEGFCLLTTDNIYYLSSDGVEQGKYRHGGSIGTASICDEYVAITFPENTLGSENRIIILDGSLTVCYNAVIEEKIVDLTLSADGHCAVLTSGHGVMIDIASRTTSSQEISTSAKKLIATGGTTALLCTTSSAKTLDFSASANSNMEE